MTNTTQKGKRPNFDIFHVVGEGKQSRWTKIGATWDNKSGEYFFLDMKYLPLDQGKLVGRKHQENQEGQ